MQIDAMLCNHAEAVNNQLYIAGGGVNLGTVPPGLNPPYAVTLGLGIIVTVPWELTNQEHKVEIEIISEDGQPVTAPVAADTATPLHVELAFNVGRPPGLPAGDAQVVSLAANMPGLPLPAIGMYEFIVRVDGHDERRLAYRIQPSTGPQMAVTPPRLGPGPSGLPTN